MIKTILSATALLLTTSAWAKTVTAMHYVEKSSYSLQRLVNQHQIDASFLTDVNVVKVDASSTGAVVELQSPAATSPELNTLSLTFDAHGTLVSFATDFKSPGIGGPLFTPTNSATIIDLGAEAVVDHLTESPDLPIVAQSASSLTFSKEDGGLHLRILLQDRRTYHIMMDDKANVLSKGF